MKTSKSKEKHDWYSLTACAEREIRSVIKDQVEECVEGMVGFGYDKDMHPVEAAGLMAKMFDFDDGCWKSSEEMYVSIAQDEINVAKQKIRDMRVEIERQEAIINKANSTILKNRRILSKESTTKGRGRRSRPELREQIVKYFVMNWVQSLKVALKVKTCGAKGGLANLFPSTSERNWGRWLNGDALPSYATFETLLDAHISSEKFKGKGMILRDVAVMPTNNQILTLLRFI